MTVDVGKSESNFFMWFCQRLTEPRWVVIENTWFRVLDPLGVLWVNFGYFFVIFYFSKMFCHVFTLRYRGLICVMCNDKDFDNHDIWIQCLNSQNKWCATRLILIWKDGEVETSSIVFWSNSHIRERRKGKLIETLQISILLGWIRKNNSINALRRNPKQNLWCWDIIEICQICEEVHNAFDICMYE